MPRTRRQSERVPSLEELAKANTNKHEVDFARRPDVPLQVPLPPEELDAADAALSGRPTLAQQLGWEKEDYAAVEAAIDEQRWVHPKDSETEAERLLDKIDRLDSNQPGCQPLVAPAGRLNPANINLQKMPAKKSDMSNYFDAAKLTDKQRECISLRFEHEWPVAKIARRLSITRKTVDEHIAAAKKKINLAQASDRRSKEKAKSGIL
jgi:DNA-binding CsgD family transcriptional regulator